MSVNYGSKRIVTGAHYGLRDWLAHSKSKKCELCSREYSFKPSTYCA